MELQEDLEQRPTECAQVQMWPRGVFDAQQTHPMQNSILPSVDKKGNTLNFIDWQEDISGTHLCFRTELWIFGRLPRFELLSELILFHRHKSFSWSQIVSYSIHNFDSIDWEVVTVFLYHWANMND